MIDKETIKKSIKDILFAIGEDPDREGLRETPKRVSEMYEEIFSGIKKDLNEELNTHFVEEDHEEMVLVKNIPFYSVCEHHLLPFTGKAHVAYIPNGRIVGLSKLARVIDTASRQPQLQERLTSQVADAINESLKPSGVLVIVEAEHHCMSMRGIKKSGAITTTSAIRGIFKTNDSTRREALSLINK